MGRIERPPSWILKYKERIEQDTITVEEILDEENKLRASPIKISSVTRAINAMGYPITGLRKKKNGEEAEELEVEEAKEITETQEESERIDKGPEWLQKYREQIEKGTITVEEILEKENKTRESPIKLATAKRAINAMGYHITELRSEKKGGAEGGEKEGEAEEAPEMRVEETTVKGSGPGWLQKYRERIEQGTITIDEILEEENKIRESPMKRSSVTRAINAMGHPIKGLQRGKKGEAVKEEEAEEAPEMRVEETTVKGSGPGWLQKYRERIEQGTITIDEILEEENKIRESPMKRSSVTRAVNAQGYPITEMQKRRREAAKEIEKTKKAGKAEVVAYSSSIGKISEATAKRFNQMKKSWEKDLGKSLQNDYFANILLALATLAEHGKALVPVKK